jgi:hypothetical protein
LRQIPSHVRVPRLLVLGIAVMIMGRDAWSVDGGLAGAATRECASVECPLIVYTDLDTSFCKILA